jgi:hypothetical protein
VRVRDHVLVATASAALAAPFIGRGAVGLWAGGVLIDADHYVWFCLRHRSLSPSRAMRFFNQADPARHQATRLLHAPVAVLCVLLLGLRQRRLLPAAFGMVLHAGLDTRHAARMDRARSAALARDNYSCQACGTEAPPVVTHLWRQPLLLPSYRSENLISLCRSCHEAAHTGLTGPVAGRISGPS